MPTTADHQHHRRPTSSVRRSSSHSRTSSSSSKFGHGLGMTTGAADPLHPPNNGAMAPPKLRKKSTSDGSSFHSNHHVRLTSHRSETHIPRLGAIQRTPSTTTIIDDDASPSTSAPVKQRGLMQAGKVKKNGSREAVAGDEEGWESNSDGGDGDEGLQTKKKTRKVSGSSGGGRARAASGASQTGHPAHPARKGSGGPPAVTAVEKRANAMFRVHSSSSDLQQTKTNGTSPVRQSFVLPSAHLPPPEASLDHPEHGLPTPPITASPEAEDGPKQADEENDEVEDTAPTPVPRRAVVRPAASSSSLSAQLLRHASTTDATGLHHSVTSPSPATSANRAKAAAAASAATSASAAPRHPSPHQSPPRKSHSAIQLVRTNSDRSNTSTNSSNLAPNQAGRHRRNFSGGALTALQPAPAVAPTPQVLTTQPNLHPEESQTPEIPAADPHPSPPSSVDAATVVGADEHLNENRPFDFPVITDSPEVLATSVALPHRSPAESSTNNTNTPTTNGTGGPQHPSIRGVRPPQLRTASSRSSLNSFTGSRNFAPRRLVSVSSTGPTTAPPQLSEDWATANPPAADQQQQQQLSTSPENDGQSLRADSRAGGGGGDAIGHLRKASFSSSLHGGRGGGHPRSHDLENGSSSGGGRPRTTSMASLRSIDTDSRSNAGGRFTPSNNGPSAMQALRSSTLSSSPTQSDSASGRTRERTTSGSASGGGGLTSSASSSSLFSDGLKRTVLSGLSHLSLTPHPHPQQPSSPGGGGHPGRAASSPLAQTAFSNSQGAQGQRTNVALVSHFQRERVEEEEEEEEGRESDEDEERQELHPSPFWENHRALLRGMRKDRGGAGGKGVGGGQGGSPMGLSVRRCLALR